MANPALAVCRVCLADNIRMHSIRNSMYQEMFEKLSGTKLITEDGRPDTVCYICNSQLRRFRTMYVMSQNSELKLTKLLRGGKKLTKRKMSMLERETYNLSITPIKNTSTDDIPMTPENKTIRTSVTETPIKSMSTNLVRDQPIEKQTRSVLEHLLYEHSYSMLALEVDKLHEMEVDSMDDQTYNDDANDTLSGDLLSERDIDANAEETLSDLLNDEEFRLHFVDEPSEAALAKSEVPLTVTKAEVELTVSKYELASTGTKPEALTVTKPEAALTLTKPKVPGTGTKSREVTKPPARKKKSEMLAIELALKAEMEKLCGIEIDHDVGEHHDHVTAVSKTDEHQKTYEDAIPNTQTHSGVEPSEFEVTQEEVTSSVTGKTHSRNLRSSDTKIEETDDKKDLNKSSDTEKANVTHDTDEPSNAKMDKTSKLRRAYLRHTSIDMKPAAFKPRNTRKTQLRNRSTDSDTAVNEPNYETDMSVDANTPEMPVDTKPVGKRADFKVLEKPGNNGDEATSDVVEGVMARKAAIRKGRNKSGGMPQVQKPGIETIPVAETLHTHNTRRSTPKNKPDAKGDKGDSKGVKNVAKNQGYSTNVRKSLRNVLKKKAKQVGQSKSTVRKLAHLRGKLVKTGKNVLKNKANARNLGNKSTDIEVDVKVESLDLEIDQGHLDEDIKNKNRTEDDPMDGSHNNTAKNTVDSGIRDSILEDWAEDDEPTSAPENNTTIDKEDIQGVNATTKTVKASNIDEKRIPNEEISTDSLQKSTPDKRARKTKNVKKLKDSNTDFGCELCPNSFNSKLDLREHQMEMHKSYCYICSKTLSNAGHLKNHMLIHTGEKPFVCKVCGKRTNNKSNMTKHMIVHKQNKPFCVICNRVIHISLAEHMIKIHEPKIVTPNTDPEKSKNDMEKEDAQNNDLEKSTNDMDSPNMDEEKTINDTENEGLSNIDLIKPINDMEKVGLSNTVEKKPVPKRKSKLKKPMKARKGKSMKRKQEGLKIITGKVSCTKCEMRFSSLSALAEHYKAHNRKAPFSCDICFEKFNHLILLKRHVVVHIM